MTNLPAILRLPLIASQALWVGARATRLPEAAGPRQGQAGEGPPLRLLILGDSSAAGVGVDHQDQALSGQLVTRLAPVHAVQWHLWAQSGATSSAALRMLAGQTARSVDVAVLALGVNDVKNGVHITRWQANYRQVINVLKTRFDVRHICASGVPPLGSFPLLPQPLRAVLGARVARFDAALADICATTRGVVHMPFDMALDPELVAADGFHPNAALYDIWAKRTAAAIRAHPLL